MNSSKLPNKDHLNAIQTHAKIIPLKYQNLFLKVASGRGGKRDIIKAKCQSCVNFENVSAQVGGCTCRLCPIWAYRPYQNRNGEGQL